TGTRTRAARRAGGDRAGVPALHAPAGGVLGRRGDGALPAPLPSCVERGLERLPPHYEHRAPADLLPARAGERDVGGARHAERTDPLSARALRAERHTDRGRLPRRIRAGAHLQWDDADAQPRLLLAPVALDPELGRTRESRGERRPRRGALPVRDL